MALKSLNSNVNIRFTTVHEIAYITVHKWTDLWKELTFLPSRSTLNKFSVCSLMLVKKKLNTYITTKDLHNTSFLFS